MTDLGGEMDKRDRVQAALAGIWVDRPPFSFWYHFPDDQVAGEPCARAHLEHYRRHHLDFLKVMNDNGYPRPEGGVSLVGELEKIRVKGPEEPEFRAQLDALEIISSELGDETLFITTLFNPLSVLGKLTGGRAVEMLAEDEDAADTALSVIAQTLAEFADACITAGAAGIFMSCSDRAVEEALGPGTYARLCRPHDLTIFERVRAAPFNVVHVHDRAADFDGFLRYPVVAVNWADRTDGPPIAEVRSRTGKVLMAGMDHVGTIVEGDAEAIRAEIDDAAARAGDHPFIVAPGCSFPCDAPEEHLQAVYGALDNWRKREHPGWGYDAEP